MAAAAIRDRDRRQCEHRRRQEQNHEFLLHV
jgi:hypothetical protein